MAQMGFRTFNEMIGQTDCLDKADAIDHWKAQGLDFTKHLPQAGSRTGDIAVYNSERQDHPIDKAHPGPQADR